MNASNPEKTREDILMEEWKECRSSIARFDEMLLSIRRYGFSFITILLGIDGYILAKNGLGPLEVIGIYFALGVLIIALFRIDRYHAVFLRGAVYRAGKIEEKLGMALSVTISKMCLETRTSASTMGNWIYVCFCLANAFILFASLSKTYALTLSNILLFVLVLVLPFPAIVLVYHAVTKYQRKKKPKEQEEV